MSIVNKRELAEILGVSERTLTDWQSRELMPIANPAAERGQAHEYDTNAVIGWLIQRELSRMKHEKPRDRLDRVKADVIELELAEKLGQLAPLDVIEQTWVTHITAARTELLTMVDVINSELAARYGVEIDPDIVLGRVRAALEKLSHFEVDNEFTTDNGQENAPVGADIVDQDDE